MGSSSSCTKVKTFDQGNQTSSRPATTPVPKPYDPLFVHVPKKPSERRVSVQAGLFELDTNIEEYSAIWDHDIKLSTPFQQSSKSGSKKREHHQKEIFNNKWIQKGSATCNSTHIESTIDTETNSSINLYSSDKIDELINNLNNIHKQLDEIIKRRANQVSNETETVLSHILNETQEKQQRLLTYAKQQQSKQDENYQKLLEEYISQLDEIKAKELADLQKQLHTYQEQILEESQLKIMKVNEQANIIKGRILQEQQHQASKKIDSIISQIRILSTDENAHDLSSKIKTETNIITNTTVGTKASGQGRTVDFQQNKRTGQRSPSNNKSTS